MSNPLTPAEVTAWLREQESRQGNLAMDWLGKGPSGYLLAAECDRNATNFLAAADLIESLTAERDAKEVCICSAVKSADGLIMRGQRHHDCIRSMRDMNWSVSNKPELQGFITSRNRFVSRVEALAIQKEAGIPSAQGEYRSNELFSEDLY